MKNKALNIILAEILKDENSLEELLSLSSVSQIKEFLEQKGYEVTESELQSYINEMSARVSDESLEEVAGGLNLNNKAISKTVAFLLAGASIAPLAAQGTRAMNAGGTNPAQAASQNNREPGIPLSKFHQLNVLKYADENTYKNYHLINTRAADVVDMQRIKLNESESRVPFSQLSKNKSDEEILDFLKTQHLS